MPSVIDAVSESVSALVSEQVGEAHVVATDVARSMNPEAGEDGVVVRITLSDPVGETWPLTTTKALRDRIRKLLDESEIEASSVTLAFVPEHPDYGEDS